MTYWMDGGRQARASRRPIHGRNSVARLMSFLLVKIFPSLEFTYEPVNGGLGVLWWDDDRLIAVTEAVIDNGEIVALHSVMNPDKLAYIRCRVRPPGPRRSRTPVTDSSPRSSPLRNRMEGCGTLKET